jgi:tRNA threonylcarbamoyladenosine biosynthesis protein TsaB
MDYLLFIDTSTDAATVCIAADSNVVASRTSEESRNHAATINNMVADTLNDAGILLENISAFVVCAGPGSYTGLRIGMATAKGYCYALDKPLIADNRLTLLAYQAHRQHPGKSQYISLLKAREKEYFIAIYDEGFNCTLEPQHISEEQLSLIVKKDNSTIITDVAEVANSLEMKNLHVEKSVKLDLESWSFYAFGQLNCNGGVNLSVAEPFYLKQVYTHK